MNIELQKKTINRFLGNDKSFSWLLFLLVTVIFTLILYPNLAFNRYSYRLGDVAKRDIKAPFDFLIEDSDATSANRKQAFESVLTVYDHDAAMSRDVDQRLQKAFSDMRKAIQTYKQQFNEKAKAQVRDDAANETTAGNKTLSDYLLEKKDRFEKAIGIQMTNGAFKILEKEEFSEFIENTIREIVTKILLNGVVANKEVLLWEGDKGVTLRTLETKTETIETTLRRFYSLDQAKTMVRVIGQPLLENTGYTLKGLVVDFSQRLVQPNITLNRNETEERKKRAAEEIKPFLYEIKAGEMLLREGERVNKFQLRKLEAMQKQMQNEQIITSRIGTTLVVMCLIMVAYMLHVKSHPVMERDPNKTLTFITCVLILFLLLTRISVSLADSLAPSAPFMIPGTSMYYGIPMASGAMIICLFMGMEIAVPFAVLMAVGTAIIFNNRFDFFIFFLLSNTTAAYWMQHCRERIVFIKAGLKLGLLNIVFVTAVDIYMADFSFVQLLWDWFFAFLGGLMAGIITAGVAPIIEGIFGYTTDIKLLELVNLDRPILRRLMIEASGTYHHSIIVGSMVEAAASAIGANPLLARVCGYYHDIGKINKPLYFIENQTNGKNRHDKLAPSMSSLILTSHVKDGVEIAKQHKLGKAIIDTIRQHHGTSLISYFYDRAKQQKGEDAVNIDDYRYPGPKPQTREAGLVMLADVIEAASRTLENPTPSRIQGLVQNLINKIFSDGQLDNCELTLRDLNNIAKSFIKILDGIYHHRIEYPEVPVSSSGKGKNGNSDKQPPGSPADNAGEDKKESTSHLRRLGQS
ncbi:MAG: HDIG domain-containing metalloprotein [Pseudomonadota bacterium]